MFHSFFRSQHARALVIFSCIFSVGVFGVFPAQAQLSKAEKNAAIAAQAAGVPQVDLFTVIGRVIYIGLSLLGVVFLVLMLYAGYLWMTAGGDVKNVDKAKAILRNAVIGLMIIVSAFAITAFVLNWLNGTPDAGLISNQYTPTPYNQLSTRSGSLGAGIIESHIPRRDETNVARNTPIIITFKEAIDPASFIAGWTEATSNTVNGLNADVVKVYATANGVNTALSSDKVRVKYTKDLKTFVIRPVEYLGSPVNKTPYTVQLVGGKLGIKKQDGTQAFDGNFDAGYIWQFEVSTVVDLTPPQIIDVLPEPGGKYARNAVVQINFNRPMDPTSVTGKTSEKFLNIKVLSSSNGGTTNTLVDGEFTIANDYHTVEFTTTDRCGTNSCGMVVYCLPSDSTMSVLVQAASLDGDGPQAKIFTSGGFDGAVSVTANSLDGNKNGKAEGTLDDSYTWEFGTSNDIKILPPQIEKTVPNTQIGGTSNVSVDQPVKVSFDTRLRASTLTSANALIDPHGKDETKPDTFWWSVGMTLLNEDGSDFDPSKAGAPAPTKSALMISHRNYLPSGLEEKDLNYYDPYVFHGVEDVYQNCFNPAGKCGDISGQGPNCCNGEPKGTTECKDQFHANDPKPTP